MHDFFVNIFGEGKDLNVMHTMTRTVAMFFIALIFLRIAGIRILGKKSAFDEIVAIMLGAILSRGIVGASPFGVVTASGAVLVAVHRLAAWASMKSKGLSRLTQGEPVLLYTEGNFCHRQLNACCLSKGDVLESLRLQMNSDDLSDIILAYMEPSGRISFVKRKWVEGEAS